MKSKTRKIMAIILMISAIFTGCAQNSKEEEAVEGIDSRGGSLKVYASFYPYYDFATNIGGNHVEIATVIPTGTEPHSFEPSPKIIAELEKADVFIYNGLDMEPWLHKVLNLLEGKEIYLVDASSVVEVVEYNASGEDHSHEEDHSNEEDHRHGQYDPHIWVDPLNVIKISEAIKEAFVHQDPDNKIVYEENFNIFKEELEKLDKAFIDELKEITHRKILVSHSAFGYLARRYDIEEISVAGISPNAEPSPKRLAELTKVAKENKMNYIFFEALANVKTAEVLANEAGLEVLTLYNVEGLTEEHRNEGENYISLMYKNLATLKKALVK